jgi:tetratricopeptide (TPR) repeat protein
MHAFIVRPFGTKKGIDFDRVEEELIRPALAALKISGGATAELIYQGNIRTDMFEQLLTADLVVADISIHNANAFYELGIRHALRNKRTFLIKCKSDDVPFDLKTDRYLPYDATNPAVGLPALTEALKATLDSQQPDSPVFQLLPGLEPADPSKFVLVPRDFREEVARAESSRNLGCLQMMTAEVDGFAWSTMGLRLMGHAQFKLKDWPGARTTWEAVRKYDDTDLEANTLLGTIYQRLGDLVKSDQALERALENRGISSWDRAEIRALMARNAKALWEADWRDFTEVAAAQKAALCSPYLDRSFDLYRKGFIEDRNHFYSGLNALAMLTVKLKLVDANPEIWEDDFDFEEEAALQLRKLEGLRSDLAAAVKLAIESKRAALARDEQTDIWAEISAADLVSLSATKPNRVSRAFQKALAGAPDLACEAASNQLRLYQRLGILLENTQAALDTIPVVAQGETATEATPRVILFTGHRIDAPDRQKPRFPPGKEDQARAMILAAVRREMEKTGGKLLGITGGACGGDILFHEVCEALDIPSRMYLIIPKEAYIKASVADGGPGWVERFNRLFAEKQPEIHSDAGELPRWLRAKKDYSIWQRSNLWMLYSALAISKDHLTLIALWNGEAGDGPGGTADMVERAQDRGATFIHLDARELVE